MNRIRIESAAALVLALAIGIARPSSSAPVPGAPSQRTLPNGLRVVVFPRPGSGLVEAQLRIEAGTGAERDDQRGAAPLVARMLRLGTSSRDAEAFAADVDRLGGRFTATASRENAIVALTLLPDDLEPGLELLSDAVTGPLFDDPVFERARALAMRELLQLHADPAAAASEQLWSATLSGVPAARSPLGDLGSVVRLTREAVRAFHRDHYRPDQSVLEIAGDVTPDRALEVATEWFGRWSGRGQRFEPGAAAPPAAGTRILLFDRPDLRNAHVRLGWRLPGRDAADDAARTVGITLLEEALNTRLSGKLAGASAIEAGFGRLRQAGILEIGFQVPAESAAVCVERVRRAVHQLRAAGPDEARLAEVTGQIGKVYPLRFETLAGALSVWQSFDGLGTDAYAALASYPARVGALRAADVAAALRRDWNEEPLTLVVIGPAAALRAPLARLGTLREAKLDELPSAAPAGEAAAAAPEDLKLGRERAARMIAAHGGEARVRGVRTSITEARVRLVLDGRELRGTLRQLRKEPLKMSYQTSFDAFETRQILNGNRAWGLNPDGQLQDADSLGVRGLVSGFATDVPHLLLAASDPAATVVARGTVRIGGRDAWAIDVTAPGFPRRRLYLDPETSLLAAMEQAESGPTGVGLVARRLYRDVRDVNGFKLPFEEERQLQGSTVMHLFYTRQEINPTIDDNEFERPASMPQAPRKP